MDLSSAIEHFSEYFVAANTRTSLTDFAETTSNSLDPTGGNFNNCTMNNMSSQNISTSNNHLGLPFDEPSSTNGSANVNIHNKLIDATQTQTSGMNSHHQLPTNSESDPFGNDLGCNNNNSTTNHSGNHAVNETYQREYPKYRTNRKSESYAQSSLARLSQPNRTQVPIHCLIEQFDNYAPISSYNYQPILNDNDLFRTEDPTDPANTNSSHNYGNGNSSHHNQPHLHQSKLALESVTNGSATSISVPTSNTSFFNNSTSNNHPDANIFEQIDTNLDQLGSDSPLSIHPSNPMDRSTPNNDIQSTGILDDPINIRQDSYLDKNQQLSSSKETYVIIGSNTLYIDVLPAILKNLGYSSLEIISAKATIQIKNWKPIPLDQVTDDTKATVGEVLSDISSFATIRIVLVNSNSVAQVPMEWNETMIRQVVLALTQTMSQLTLSKLCNISQPLISSIVRGGKKLGRRKCMEFGQWYMNYVKSNGACPTNIHTEGSGRLVFDKRREIPRLKHWFAENAKPTDEILAEYSKIMNDDPVRKDRPQVSTKALKNWWKNERQKLGIRQREIRGRSKLKEIDG